MTAFLVIVLIIGNLLLISGSMFGDLSDNGTAWFVVIAAIAMDCYFIYKIIQSVSESHEKKRLDEATQKVNEILARYSPSKMFSIQEAKKLVIDPSLINKEVVFCVKEYKNSISSLLQQSSKVNARLMTILSCKGYTTEIEKADYLTSKLPEIENLKNESDELNERISKNKIKILNEDGDLLFLVKKSFAALFSSKKCVLEGYTLKELICEEKPVDLELFDYKYAPAILHIDKYYYCLFSNVILVFDDNGIFSSAIDPSALSIKSERLSADVWINNNTLPAHQYIDVDSKCIEQGTTRHTWLHTCRDGSPDLRYSYNPRIEYRTDKYEYGKITLSVLDSKIQFALSSDAATKALERVGREYIQKHNNRHNPLPEFFNLLYRMSEDGDTNIAYILDATKSNPTTSNYFCIIG